MRNISLDRTEKKSFHELKKLIPTTKRHFRGEANTNTEKVQIEPLDEVPHLNLLKSLGQEAIELSFASISDVSIECVKTYDDVAKRVVKTLMLTVSNLHGRRKVYLIALKDLITDFSKGNEEDLSEVECEFANRYHNLSLREQTVLHEVSRGNTSNEIACKLFISTNTVKNHRKNIKKKLSFDDNQEYSKFLKWSLEYCGK